MGQDRIRVTVLEDGVLKIETDQISMANHVSADELLEVIQQKMGGTVTIESRVATPVYVERQQEVRR